MNIFIEKNKKIKFYVVVFCFFLVIISPYNSLYHNSYGHSFDADDFSYFISNSKLAEIELKLALESFPSNITLATNYTDNAAGLVSDLYYFNDDVADDTDFIKRYDEIINTSNSTIQSIALINLIDEVMNNYADSIGLDFDTTNMTNLLVLVSAKESTDKNNTEVNRDKQLEQFSTSNDFEYSYEDLFSKPTIVNYEDYKVAEDIILEINTLFQTYLKSIPNLDKSSIRAISELERDLLSFNNMIENRESPGEIMELVHLKIHPNMQKIYELKTSIDYDNINENFS
ncbi:MAG: hypothetical protein ACPKPY_06865 [Nitrososphaeraceae archaeon]